MNKNESFIDYYEMFSLERSMSEKEIKRILSRKQAEVSKLQGSTSRDEVETIRELQEIMGHLRKAIQSLAKPDARKSYDAELDAAIMAGKVNKESVKDVQDALERAREFFKQGKYDLALECANEVITNNANNEEPYEIISRSYFLKGDYDEALEAIHKASSTFVNSLKLRWLNIRFLIMTESYNEAQSLLNQSMIDFNNSSQLAAEQIYLYGYAERDDLIRKTVNEYIQKNPNDENYRRYVAMNLIEISQQCYIYDSDADLMLLTEEKLYNRSVELVTLANSIYQNADMKAELEYVQQFSERSYDSDNLPLEIFYHILGIIPIIFAFRLLDAPSLAMVLFVIGIAIQGLGVLVYRLSFRPNWKVYRDYYRGFKESDDGLLFTLLRIPWDLTIGMFIG